MVYNSKPDGDTTPVTVIIERQEQEPRTVTVQVSDRPHLEQQPAATTRPAWSFKNDQDADAAPTISAAPTRKQSDFARAFYTVPQAAEILQVHENTIYNLVRAGKVEHYKVGAQIRIARAELERLKVERKA